MVRNFGMEAGYSVFFEPLDLGLERCLTIIIIIIIIIMMMMMMMMIIPVPRRNNSLLVNRHDHIMQIASFKCSAVVHLGYYR